MAEILLSLTIIGVVAAITLPSLTGNINERTWNTQRKALYARFSQAIALMPALNGYGTLTADASGSVTEDTAAETFVTAGLAKVLKINNICDNEHLEDCGINSTYINMLGSKNNFPLDLHTMNAFFSGTFKYYDYSFSMYNTKAAAFETANGESIAVFYNPFCQSSIYYRTDPGDPDHLWFASQANMCANFIFDLNGNKGPNTVGKDIGFISAFNAIDTEVVSPMPMMAHLNSTDTMTHAEALRICKNRDDESRIPNITELDALFTNEYIMGLDSLGGHYWSGSKYTATHAWAEGFDNGLRGADSVGSRRKVLCIKR